MTGEVSAATPVTLAVWRRLDVLLASLAIAVLATTVPLAAHQALAGAAGEAAVLPAAGWAVAAAALAGTAALWQLRHALVARTIARHVHHADLAGADALIVRAAGRPDGRRRLARLFDAIGLQAARPWPLAAALASVPDLLRAVVAGAVLLLVWGPPALWVLGVAALLAAAVGGAMAGAVRAERRESAAQEQLAALTAEILAGIVTVKALAVEEAMMRRVERLAETVAAHAARRLIWGEVVASVAAMLPWAAAGAAVLAGLTRTAAEVTGPADWLVVVALAWLVGQALGAPGAAWGALGPAMARDRRAVTGRRRPAGGRPGADPVSGRLRPAIKGHLELESVTLRYDETAPPVLDDVSLVIAPGEMVAIGGDSGAGKSSIIALFLGLAMPAAGRVLIDGRPLAAYEPAPLSAQLGWIGQDAPLLRGTLLDNLTLFRGGAVQETALHLAGEMGLLEAVRRLPAGLDTPLGTTVMPVLSDGVRHRIAIVRALAPEPPVVLFDDAGTALDHDGDRRLKQVLAALKGRATVIVSSHRPSLAALADRRYRVSQGRLYHLAADGGVEEAPALLPDAGDRPAGGADAP